MSRELEVQDEVHGPPVLALRVAEQLLGASKTQFTLTTTQLRGGLANCGCFLHEAATRSRRQSVKFVEKRTRLPREIRFGTEAATLYANSSEPICPIIYHVDCGVDYTTICMEYVDGVDGKFERTLDNAKGLAVSIAEIARIDPARVPSGVPRLTASRVELFARVAEAEGLTHDSETKALVSRIEQAAARIDRCVQERLPKVASHNDIGFSNMAVVQLGDRVRVRFVDWGQFNLNVVGSDFHHIYGAALYRPDLVDFAHHAALSYTRAIRDAGVSPTLQDIQLGAYYYSLQRTLSRYIRWHQVHAFEAALRVYRELRTLI